MGVPPPRNFPSTTMSGLNSNISAEPPTASLSIRQSSRMTSAP